LITSGTKETAVILTPLVKASLLNGFVLLDLTPVRLLNPVTSKWRRVFGDLSGVPEERPDVLTVFPEADLRARRRRIVVAMKVSVRTSTISGRTAAIPDALEEVAAN
jgi:hypothetical protein